MRHFSKFAILTAVLFNSLAYAQIEDCSTSANELYKDIQIFRETEKVKPTKGIVGSRLNLDLNYMKSANLSTAEKVQSLEAGYAKCYVRLSLEEQMLLDQSISNAVTSLQATE